MEEQWKINVFDWDKAFEKALLGKTGIAYGDDLLQGQNLPTAFAMTRDIVLELNGITFPGCKHLYFDNFVDYKLKLKLSELLKNKRKAASANNEFNEEEVTADKGVNLYLSMKGPISNIKISYDKIGTKQKITQELKQEKQNIKEILKKELGISTGDKKENEIKEKKNDTDELEFEPE